RKRSAAVRPRPTTSSDTVSLLPSARRAERATIDIICAESRPRSSRACSSEISLSLPSFQSPERRAVCACRSAGARPVSPSGSNGSGSAMRDSMSSSTSSPQTFSYGYLPISGSTSTPRYRSVPPSRSGSMISVSTATTPSRPGLKSLVTELTLQRYRTGFAFPPHVRSVAVAHRVTLIPGDGTGPELVEAARRVLEATGVEFDWDVRPAGASVMDEHGGNPLPEETLESIRHN